MLSIVILTPLTKEPPFRIAMPIATIYDLALIHIWLTLVHSDAPLNTLKDRIKNSFTIFDHKSH